jgi:hypothetical protein
MKNERAIKLDLPETDTLCVRSVCRNSQVKPQFLFSIEKRVNILVGKDLNWFKNIRYC